MSYFHSNASFLSQYNQWILGCMESVATDHIETVQVGEDIVFKLADEQGNEFFSASIYDTVYEAEQFLDGVNFDNTGYILMGIGSSAIVKSILKNKTEASWFFIIEKDMSLIKKFLEEVDLAPYLQDKMERVVFFTGDLEELSVVLSTYVNSLVGYYFLKTDLLRTFATYRRDKQYYESVVEIIINQIRFYMTSMGNSLQDTLMGMTNELKNLPVILKSHRLKELRGRYAGKPIICVASGPSLDKQLPLLKQAKGKALIVSAESAFRVLLKNGIAPDIVGILERGPNSYELSVQGVNIPEDTALMGLTVMDSRIPKEWNEYVIPIFKENVTHSRFLNEALGDFGSISTGSSVAHLNYSLSEYMGGSPIVFIGQDLAYSEEGTTHSKDSFYIDQSDMNMTEDQRKQLQDSLQDDESFFNKPVMVDGYYGGKVKSRELWHQFLYWMEQLIIGHPGSLVINATEGGADIKGTVKMPFRKVLETYCKEPIPSIPETFASLPPVPNDMKEILATMVERINDVLGEMESISTFAQEILSNAERLQEDLKNKDAVDFLELRSSRILRSVEQLVKRILENPFITFFYRPLLSNYHVKMNPISRVSSVERLQEILTHQSYLLDRIVEGKKEVIKVYEEGIANAVQELGLDPEEIKIMAEVKWDLPEWIEET
ncbi:motility associated factor glycosyltransferase family protein [Brevibacillus borstelensis]|uniref:motility associated factor glycosyltransferase family protein n=1 Tax=Brevibacillus borstelensis TaxID=45462 RepID=UPI002E2364CE|nr:DUF115 domain-containing protein [Brevibacillus borstelensis]